VAKKAYFPQTLKYYNRCRLLQGLPLVEYRITIGSKTNGPGLPGRPPSKLEVLKAALVGLLGLAIVIGILLAAFVVGSIIASVLLILLAVALIIWLARRLLVELSNLKKTVRQLSPIYLSGRRIIKSAREVTVFITLDH
jgi:hypothetical protein